MNDGLTVGLSAQLALEKRLTTIASNIANTRTVGFRAAEVKFEDVVSRQQVVEGINTVAYASGGAEFANTQSGAIEKTGAPLDFAINGDAWFALQTPAGTAVTRDGRFTVRGDGAVVSLAGHPVLDPGGAPLEVNPEGGRLDVGADGFIRQDGNQVGALGVFAYEPGPDFVRHADSGILVDGEPQPIVDAPDVTVVQGYVEQSNVDPVEELTQLIMVQRSFENANALIRDTEDSLSKLINAFHR
ncbi:MAG: flagellar basal-body rod protein FlgF [Roseitalea sp.]|jgi:flagellar basal-body rod protein FlgF|nr:flagellar basal-body rod protein FlgF [Roseitalea sp.]MBO6741359.1 flagellar basal-body rod protein FlgF [Roseitalea sp.]